MDQEIDVIGCAFFGFGISLILYGNKNHQLAICVALYILVGRLAS